MKALRIVVPVVVLAGLGLLAYGLVRDQDYFPSELIALPAPQFELANMFEPSDSIALADLSGKVVVLNFWASWCAPCILEHPYLEQLTHDYDREDVELVGLLYQDTPERGLQFIEQYGGGWPTLLDPGSRTAIPYGVTGPPETFVIAPDGLVVYKLIGPLTPRTYPIVTATIDSLLATRTNAPMETARAGEATP